jgi:hypothetical protein
VGGREIEKDKRSKGKQQRLGEIDDYDTRD